MGTFFDFFSRKVTGTTDSQETRDVLEFINMHTVQLNGGSDVVIIAREEFNEFFPTKKEDDTESTIPDNETTSPTRGNPEIESPSPNEEIDPLGRKTDELLGKIDEIKNLVEKETRKDEIIKEMHKEMERLNSNFLEDIRRPMIKSIIAIHKQMYNRSKNIEKTELSADTDYELLYGDLKKNIEFDKTAIVDTLEDEYDLEFFEPVEGDLYNPKEDNAIKVVVTDDAILDGKIKEVIYGGFKNPLTEKVFMKANVIVYKLK